MNLEQTIIARLQETSGNVQSVARELDVSVSYVNRIKNNNDLKFVAIPPGRSQLIVPPPTVSASDVQPKNDVGKAAERLAPNLAAVTKVRDRVLGEIERKLEDQTLDSKQLNAILQTLLRYENKLNELSQPTQISTTIVADQRTQNVHLYQLVDKLAGADPSLLRELAGFDPPQLIDGEVLMDN